MKKVVFLLSLLHFCFPALVFATVVDDWNGFIGDGHFFDKDVSNLRVQEGTAEALHLTMTQTGMSHPTIYGDGEFSDFLRGNTNSFFDDIQVYLRTLSDRRTPYRIPVQSNAILGFLNHVGKFSRSPGGAWTIEDRERVRILLEVAGWFKLSPLPVAEVRETGGALQEGEGGVVPAGQRLTVSHLADLVVALENTALALRTRVEEIFATPQLLTAVGDLDPQTLNELVLSMPSFPDRRLTVHVEPLTRTCFVAVGTSQDGYLFVDGAGLLGPLAAANNQTGKGMRLPSGSPLSRRWGSTLSMNTHVLGKLEHTLANSLTELAQIEECMNEGRKLVFVGHGLSGSVAEELAREATQIFNEKMISLSKTGFSPATGVDPRTVKPVRAITLGALSGFTEGWVRDTAAVLGLGGVLRVEDRSDLTASTPYSGCMSSEQMHASIPRVWTPGPSDGQVTGAFFTRDPSHQLIKTYHESFLQSGGLAYFQQLATLYRLVKIEGELFRNLLTMLEEGSRQVSAAPSSLTGNLPKLMTKMYRTFGDAFEVRQRLVRLSQLSLTQAEHQTLRTELREQLISTLGRIVSENTGRHLGSLETVTSVLFSLRNEQLIHTRVSQGAQDALTTLRDLSSNIRAVIASARNYFKPFLENLSKHTTTFVDRAVEVFHSSEAAHLFSLKASVSSNANFGRRVDRVIQALAVGGLGTRITGVLPFAGAGTTGTRLVVEPVNQDVIGVFKARKSEDSGSLTATLERRLKASFGQARVLSKEPGAQAMNEVIAFEFALMLGLEDFLPISVDTRLAIFDQEFRGTFMEFLSVYSPARADGSSEVGIASDDFQKMALFDILLGNLDRHFDNIYVKNSAGGEGSSYISSDYLSTIMVIDNANILPNGGPGMTASHNMYLWSAMRRLTAQPFTSGVKSWFVSKVKPFFYGGTASTFFSNVQERLGNRHLVSPDAFEFMKLRYFAIHCVMDESSRVVEGPLSVLARLKTREAIREYLATQSAIPACALAGTAD